MSVMPKGVDVVPQQFPKDTEIMHSVRYVGVDDEENIRCHNA